MNHEEIIKDFEILKQEILEFKRSMTVDDFYFYELQSPKKFDDILNALCKKYFNSSWDSLEDHILKLFKDASANKSTKQIESIHALNSYLFGKEISYDKKYVIEYEDDPDEEPDWRGATAGKEREIWNGEYEVRNIRNQSQECFKTDIEVLKPEKHNIPVKNWRMILNSLIQHPWEVFSGRIDDQGKIRRFNEYDLPRKLSDIDYTCFLALKNALRSDLYINTHQHEILLQVSSGIAAKIAFRKTGNYAIESIQSEKQIYSMTDFAWEKEKHYNYADKTVLHISGYTNSDVNLQIPNGYYFVDENYAVEVEFIAAPILMNSGILPLMATTDHASVDLLDDEEEERKRREEEDEY